MIALFLNFGAVCSQIVYSDSDSVCFTREYEAAKMNKMYRLAKENKRIELFTVKLWEEYKTQEQKANEYLLLSDSLSELAGTLIQETNNLNNRIFEQQKDLKKERILKWSFIGLSSFNLVLFFISFTD